MTTAARRPRSIVFLAVIALALLTTTTPTLAATPATSQGDMIAGQYVVTLRPVSPAPRPLPPRNSSSATART